MINCRYCNQDKPSDEFYQSTIRRNGKSGDCKECIRARVRENRTKKAKYYREFDRKRANLPHRVKARAEYAQTEQGKKANAKARKVYKERYPHRRSAHNIVNNAVRDGRLDKPSQCEACGVTCNPHGHHCDYNKPLEVMWLCEPCHKKWHRNNEPIYYSDTVLNHFCKARSSYRTAVFTTPLDCHRLASFLRIRL